MEEGNVDEVIVRARRLAGLVAVAVLAAAPATGDATTTRTPQKKKVAVEDNYYLPTKLTVNKGSTISWVWNDGNIEDHDVKLKSGPKGETKFWSEPGGIGYVYKRTLKHPGTYKIICTFHDEMTMTITVRH